MSAKTRYQKLLNVATISAVLALSACSTVSELPPLEASEGRSATVRRYRIECVELAQCKEKASAVCGTPYAIVSEWHNDIAESDLPGLNEGSRPKDYRDWQRPTLQDRTGIESKDPMPLSSIVVACNG